MAPREDPLVVDFFQGHDFGVDAGGEDAGRRGADAKHVGVVARELGDRHADHAIPESDLA